jgi:hypothetical protein
MKKLGLALLLLSVFGVAAGFSQAKRSLIDYYNSEAISINYSVFGGLQLAYQGQVSGTQFGISQTMADALRTYSDSKSLVNSYENTNRIGNVLLYGGLAAFVASPIVMYGSIFDSYSTGSSTYVDTSGGMTTFMYLYLGGLAGMLIGSFMVPSSFEKLLQGVNSYNRHKISEFR